MLQLYATWLIDTRLSGDHIVIYSNWILAFDNQVLVSTLEKRAPGHRAYGEMLITLTVSATAHSHAPGKSTGTSNWTVCKKKLGALRRTRFGICRRRTGS